MGVENNSVLVITIRWCGVYVDFVPAVVEGMVVFLFVASVADAGGLFVWVVEWYSADAAKDRHFIASMIAQQVSANMRSAPPQNTVQKVDVKHSLSAPVAFVAVMFSPMVFGRGT